MFTIIAIIVISICLIYYLRRKFVSKFPGPPGFPVLGNWFTMANTNVTLMYMHEYTKKYGKIFKVYGGFETKLFISDVGLVEKILGSKEFITKSVEYEFFRAWLGNGIFTSTGKTWRRIRKLETPTFHFRNLENFLFKFEMHSVGLVNNLNKFAGKGIFDISKLLSAYTLDVICDSAMGVYLDVQANPNHEFPKSIHEENTIIFKRITSPLHRFNFFYKRTKLHKRELELTTYLKNFSLNIIQHRRNILMNSKEEFEANSKLSFIDLLLRNDNCLSDEEIRQEVDAFLFAGFDTTSVTLTFFIYNLACNKNVQDKIVQELVDILGTDLDKNITIDDLNQMKYLEMAIKESLRLHPTGPAVMRAATENFDWDGKKIFKGTSLFVNIWAIHRNEEIYPDPLKYDPERFSNENNKFKSYEYLPFSAGHRNCLGQKFAMLELKMVMTKVLQRFEFKSVPDFNPQLILAITLMSLNGMLVQVEKRTL